MDDSSQLRSAFRLFLGVVFLGVICVEAAYRVTVARCEHIPDHWGAASWLASSAEPRPEPDEQYAPL